MSLAKKAILLAFALSACSAKQVRPDYAFNGSIGKDQVKFEYNLPNTDSKLRPHDAVLTVTKPDGTVIVYSDVGDDNILDTFTVRSKTYHRNNFLQLLAVQEAENVFAHYKRQILISKK